MMASGRKMNGELNRMAISSTTANAATKAISMTHGSLASFFARQRVGLLDHAGLPAELLQPQTPSVGPSCPAWAAPAPEAVDPEPTASGVLRSASGLAARGGGVCGLAACHDPG